MFDYPEPWLLKHRHYTNNARYWTEATPERLRKVHTGVWLPRLFPLGVQKGRW